MACFLNRIFFYKEMMNRSVNQTKEQTAIPA